MTTITLYTLPGCVDCQAAGQAMDRKDIPFGLLNVASLPAAADFLRGLGYQGVPVTVVRDGNGTVVEVGNDSGGADTGNTLGIEHVGDVEAVRPSSPTGLTSVLLPSIYSIT